MKSDCLIVFEDEYFSGLHPISLSHPTYDILSGAKTNLERIKHYFKYMDIFTLCRPQLSAFWNNAVNDRLERLVDERFKKVILINGTVVLRSEDSEFVEELKKNEGSASYIKNGTLVAAVLPLKIFREMSKDILTLHLEGRSKKVIENSHRAVEIDILTFPYIWEPMLLGPELLMSDFNEYFKDNCSQNNCGDSFTYGRREIFAGEGMHADAASVIDARGGPVIIEEGVHVKPFTYLDGPAYVGKGCKLVGGKMTGGCSFGSGCRIGGEVENSVFIGNSNKYHEGFIGHAYIGEWVNLGALTTNSDLKNNYSEISVKQNGKVTKTGRIKIGSFIGDHSKTGIGTTLNTGNTIGFSCNIFGGTFITEKEIPSFSWGNDSLRRSVTLKSALETAEIACGRRNFTFHEGHRQLFESIYFDTEIQRKSWIKKRK